MGPARAESGQPGIWANRRGLGCPTLYERPYLPRGGAVDQVPIRKSPNSIVLQGPLGGPPVPASVLKMLLTTRLALWIFINKNFKALHGVLAI